MQPLVDQLRACGVFSAVSVGDLSTLRFKHCYAAAKIDIRKSVFDEIMKSLAPIKAVRKDATNMKLLVWEDGTIVNVVFYA